MKKLQSVFNHIALVLLSAIASASPAWAVNKCTQPDGSVAYQEAACTSGAEQKLKLQAVPESTPEEVRFANAIAMKKIMGGMTEKQARRSWGEPTKINVSMGSYGRHEQWVYDRGNFRSQYVYIENGRVTSVQSPGQ